MLTAQCSAVVQCSSLRAEEAGDARTHNQNVEIGRRILHLSLPSGMSLPDAGPVRQSQLQGAT